MTSDLADNLKCVVSDPEFAAFVMQAAQSATLTSNEQIAGAPANQLSPFIPVLDPPSTHSLIDAPHGSIPQAPRAHLGTAARLRESGGSAEHP